MFIIFILWLGCATICAYIASKRGRNVAGWFLLGLIFGIFAIPFALLMSDNSIATGNNDYALWPTEVLIQEAERLGYEFIVKGFNQVSISYATGANPLPRGLRSELSCRKAEVWDILTRPQADSGVR
jgi:hypothetical protein